MAFFVYIHDYEIFKNPFNLITMYSLNIEAQDLSEYKWKNRIVVLYETENNIAEVKSALEIIESNGSKINERDIIVFTYKNDVLYTTKGKATEIKKSSTLPKSLMVIY